VIAVRAYQVIEDYQEFYSVCFSILKLKINKDLSGVEDIAQLQHILSGHACSQPVTRRKKLVFKK
jgi:hypothetical protein